MLKRFLHWVFADAIRSMVETEVSKRTTDVYSAKENELAFLLGIMDNIEMVNTKHLDDLDPETLDILNEIRLKASVVKYDAEKEYDKYC